MSHGPGVDADRAELPLNTTTGEGFDPAAPKEGERFIFLEGALGLLAAISSPKRWRRRVNEVDPSLDPDWAIATVASSLESPQASRLQDFLLGTTVCALTIWVLAALIPAFQPSWLRPSPCPSWMFGDACVGKMRVHFALAATAVLLTGLVFALTVSLRAGLLALVFGATGTVVGVLVAYRGVPGLLDQPPDDTLRNSLAAIVAGIACGLAVGAAGASTQWGGDRRRRPERPGGMLRAAVNFLIPFTLLAGATALLTVLLAPVFEGNEALQRGAEAMDLKLGLLVGGAALVLGSPSVLAAWRRARAASSATGLALLAAIRWALLLLGPLAGALTMSPVDSVAYGIGIGLLVGAVVSGIFVLAWQAAREQLPSRAAAAVSVAAVTLLVLLVVYFGPVARGTSRQAPVLSAVVVLSVPAGYFVISSLALAGGALARLRRHLRPVD